MRRILPSAMTVTCVLGVFPGLAWASDLAEALSFAQDIMGEEIVDGYEEFVDYDETEALGLLLARDVTPGKVPEYYGDGDASDTMPKTDFFETLGGSRLSFDSLSRYIQEASAETGLPVALIDAVIRTESGYRPGAVSRAGAQGLMQLMPATAREVGVQDPLDPRQNIMGGARYLRRMYDRFGSLRLAVAAYNAGPGAVAKHDGVPPFAETRRYVDVVIRRYNASSRAK